MRKLGCDSDEGNHIRLASVADGTRRCCLQHHAGFHQQPWIGRHCRFSFQPPHLASYTSGVNDIRLQKRVHQVAVLMEESPTMQFSLDRDE